MLFLLACLYIYVYIYYIFKFSYLFVCLARLILLSLSSTYQNDISWRWKKKKTSAIFVSAKKQKNYAWVNFHLKIILTLNEKVYYKTVTECVKESNIFIGSKKTCLGVLDRRERGKDNETGLKEGGRIETSTTVLPLRDARSLRFDLLTFAR